MKRRDFVQQTAVAGGAIVLAPDFFNATKAKHIGVQLYSVRDVIFKDTIGTLRSISMMGYKEVEGFGYQDGKFFNMSPGDFKIVLEDLGLTMPTAHCGVNLQSWDAEAGDLTAATKQAVADAAWIGQKVFICPYIDRAQRDEESIRRLCDIFNNIGALCKQHGMVFGYHNHDFEYTPAGDKLIYDHLLTNTDSSLMKMQLDVYWAVYANQNPVEWFKKAPGRYISLHVKDMENTTERRTTEIGTGVIDFTEIFKYSELAGVEYYVVELEDYKTTSLEGIEVCLRNLKKLL
ncbi:MAG TPA: sugar phosphate isomerase/epimerase [Saprospiraceae bacterium]|nr:sugar phosphate isomerase/epimerase [Saprospiraceae bacterium]